MPKLFVETVEGAMGEGAIVKPEGTGETRATNPEGSGIMPMKKVTGSCELPIALYTVDRTFRVTTRVVPGLPFCVDTGSGIPGEARQRNKLFPREKGLGQYQRAHRCHSYLRH